MTTASENEDLSENDLESFTLPETVLCVDTICGICYAEFLDEDDLKLHMVQQHTTEDTTSRCCRFCSYIYASLEEYASHIINVHILDLKCCKYCLRVFTITQDVRGHEKKHLSSSSTLELRCSNCKLTFKNTLSLEFHEYSKHSDIKDGVILRDCYSLLSSFLNINAVIYLKSSGDTQEYRCVSCDFLTSDFDYYIQHLERKNCRCLVCDKCCHVFKDMKSLKKHLRANNCNNEVLNLPCKKCLKMFTFNEIEEHTNICNAVKCHSCDAVFDSVKERADHQSEVHPLMFSIKECKYCRQEYVGQEALEKHIKRTHDKKLHLYKYFCVYCDDTIFDHPKKLFSHFFRKHRNLEPFKCKICDKTFRLRKSFTLHIKLNHLSVGNVKFDDKYHVIFEQNNLSTKEISNNHQNTTEKQKTDKTETINKNDLKSTVEQVKDTQKDDVEFVLCPTENESDQFDKEKSRKVKDKTLQGDSEVDLVLCPTDKETDQSEVKKGKRLIKRKRKIKSKDLAECIDLTLDGSEDSDDEPLIIKRRRAKMRVDNIRFPKWLERSKLLKRNREKFTCKICKKYCYTYQNFQHHMTLHKNNLNKKCIKCPKVFKTTEKLNQHITKKHSTSKLTETLKYVLERRKQINCPTEINPITKERKYASELFAKTIKKVNINASDTSVKIKPVIDKLSVRKFIENFTPDSNGINCKGNTIYINNSLTIKPIIAPEKPPLIKLIKSKYNEHVFTKLKQPERFKTKGNVKYEVSIKIADPDAKPKMNFEQREESIAETTAFEDFEDSMDRNIPEVAEEVMLEDTIESKAENEPNDIQNDVSNVLEYKDFHLAHLTSQAPYYKIVKIKDVVKKTINEPQEKQIKLPNGTKLVSVNPLAHLLDGKQINLQTNKYYTPKLVNVGKAVASALLKNAMKRPPKAKKSKKTKIVNEQ
ncbi:Zinc finger protein 879 [Papilio machaon]|uniref:Zinc finger protein 879 n=1 Tax=Papilio machaon TaxID=76193 RepID=A0A0N1IQ73_PAPMA|nr:Zinc finger protein 879 [Papilio machaon]